MNALERLMHEAHLRYQRRYEGPAKTFVAKATNTEVDAANTKRANAPASVHTETKVRIKAPRLNLSEAALAQWCLNYYRYFCNHDRLLIEQCTKCKRKGLVAPR